MGRAIGRKRFGRSGQRKQYEFVSPRNLHPMSNFSSSGRETSAAMQALVGAAQHVVRQQCDRVRPATYQYWPSRSGRKRHGIVIACICDPAQVSLIRRRCSSSAPTVLRTQRHTLLAPSFAYASDQSKRGHSRASICIRHGNGVLNW